MINGIAQNLVLVGLKLQLYFSTGYRAKLKMLHLIMHSLGVSKYCCMKTYLKGESQWTLRSEINFYGGQSPAVACCEVSLFQYLTFTGARVLCLCWSAAYCLGCGIFERYLSGKIPLDPAQNLPEVY